MPVFHQKVTEYIASLPSPQKEICQSLRELILENFPQMREEFKWNSPAYYYNGKRICLASGFKVALIESIIPDWRDVSEAWQGA